jgi:hypothetical protein
MVDDTSVGHLSGQVEVVRSSHVYIAQMLYNRSIALYDLY